MVRRVSKVEQKRRLRGWLKYAPALLLFFGAIFADAWLSKQMRELDYEKGRINTRMRELDATLETIKADASSYQNFDMLEERAILLGMVDIDAQQIIPVQVDEIIVPEPIMRRDVLAQVAPVDTPDLRAVLGDQVADAAIAGTAAPQIDYHLRLEQLEPEIQQAREFAEPAAPVLDEDMSALLETL